MGFPQRGKNISAFIKSNLICFVEWVNYNIVWWTNPLNMYTHLFSDKIFLDVIHSTMVLTVNTNYTCGSLIGPVWTSGELTSSSKNHTETTWLNSKVKLIITTLSFFLVRMCCQPRWWKQKFIFTFQTPNTSPSNPCCPRWRNEGSLLGTVSGWEMASWS